MKTEAIFKKGTNVKVGAAVSLPEAYRFIDLELGNYLYFCGNFTATDMKQLAVLCRERRVYFSLPEAILRFVLKEHEFHREIRPSDLRAIEEAGGEFFLGSASICEPSGLVYFPEEYLTRWLPPTQNMSSSWALPQAMDMKEAEQFYREHVEQGIALERKIGRSKPFLIEAGFLARYPLAAGFERVDLELFPGVPEPMFAAVRGATRAYGSSGFGADVAMGWYGGAKVDELWFNRLKTGLYMSFMHGADPIYSESGHFDNTGLGNNYDFDSAVCRRHREILKEFYEFSKGHLRPAIGPITKVGIVYGRHDGYPGPSWINNRQVWGQHQGRQWHYCEPEAGWDLLELFHKSQEWSSPTLIGDADFSANPPSGVYDLVPIEAPLEVLSTYSCLIFLGWNTMTDADYGKLKCYVQAGGHLLMTAAHLGVQTRREEPLQLFNDGDVADLFGVKLKRQEGEVLAGGVKFVADSEIPTFQLPNWSIACDPKFVSGEIPSVRVELITARALARHSTAFNWQKEPETGNPLLLENRCGKGIAWLLATACYPGHSAVKPLYGEIFRSAMRSEQGTIKVASTDKIRYAVYGEDSRYRVYVLNTDATFPLSADVYANSAIPVRLEISPATMRWADVSDGKIIPN